MIILLGCGAFALGFILGVGSTAKVYASKKSALFAEITDKISDINTRSNQYEVGVSRLSDQISTQGDRLNEIENDNSKLKAKKKNG